MMAKWMPKHVVEMLHTTCYYNIVVFWVYVYAYLWFWIQTDLQFADISVTTGGILESKISLLETDSFKRSA